MVELYPKKIALTLPKGFFAERMDAKPAGPWLYQQYEIMRAHGGNMEIRGKEGEDARIIPAITYRVTM